MIVVNLYGGPGCGKSTTATGVFSKLKLAGINAEYVSEFAKDLTWEKRQNTMENQLYIFAKQQHRLWRLKNSVDIIITDSPLLLSLVYGYSSKCFKDLVLETNNQFDNINIFIDRVKMYNPSGRNQTKEEAVLIDNKIMDMLYSKDGIHRVVDGNEDGISDLYEYIVNL